MSEQPEIAAVERLLELAGRYGLQELEVEEAGLRISVEAWSGPAAPEAAPAEGAPAGAYLWRPPALPPEPAPTGPALPETAHPITAPLTGTFYRSPSPGAPAFVEVGDTVEEGQVIGLIEAMKVFSEVTADRAGRVLDFPIQSGKLVQRGDVLLYLDTAG